MTQDTFRNYGDMARHIAYGRDPNTRAVSHHSRLVKDPATRAIAWWLHDTCMGYATPDNVFTYTATHEQVYALQHSVARVTSDLFPWLWERVGMVHWQLSGFEGNWRTNYAPQLAVDMAAGTLAHDPKWSYRRRNADRQREWDELVAQWRTSLETLKRLGVIDTLHQQHQRASTLTKDETRDWLPKQLDIVYKSIQTGRCTTQDYTGYLSHTPGVGAWLFPDAALNQFRELPDRYSRLLRIRFGVFSHATEEKMFDFVLIVWLSPAAVAPQIVGYVQSAEDCPKLAQQVDHQYAEHVNREYDCIKWSYAPLESPRPLPKPAWLNQPGVRL